MIPGSMSKLAEEVIASAATIKPTKDHVVLTGTTEIANIKANLGGFSTLIFVVPKDGAVATTTTGNIATAVSMPQNRVTVLTYSKSQGKWYPGAIS